MKGETELNFKVSSYSALCLHPQCYGVNTCDFKGKKKLPLARKVVPIIAKAVEK